MEKQRLVPKGIVLPFALLCTLFLAWAIPNNLTDTMLAAFKKIMSLTDAKSAWIQIACYLCGYGCFAIPGALFIKRYTYKSGVLLGLSMFSIGAFLFYPIGLTVGAGVLSMNACYLFLLVALVILFGGCSILETATNSYVCALGSENTATQRLNFAQSFNPFGAITGVVVSQVFVLSQLNTSSAEQRACLAKEELLQMQAGELNAVTTTYAMLGVMIFCLLVTILITKMPNLKEDDKRLDFIGTFRRLFKNPNYVWGVIAQFFYVGAQIAVWSYIIRYSIHQLGFDKVVAGLGESPTTEAIIEALRGVEPVAAGFYIVCDKLGIEALMPRTAEQAGATYYIMSLFLFVFARFACTGLMQFIKPRNLLTGLSLLAVACCVTTIYGDGFIGVYSLMGISACMSLMFPTIYGLGITGLKDDTKIGGSGMVMAISGAALLTQAQGYVSDWLGISRAFWVPALAFIVIAFYGAVVCRKQDASKAIVED